MGPESPTRSGSAEEQGSGGDPRSFYPYQQPPLSVYTGHPPPGYPPHPMGQPYPPPSMSAGGPGSNSASPTGAGGYHHPGPPGAVMSPYGHGMPGGPPHSHHPPPPYGPGSGYQGRGGSGGMPPYGYGYEHGYFPSGPHMKHGPYGSGGKGSRGPGGPSGSPLASSPTSGPGSAGKNVTSPESRSEESPSVKPVEDLEAERLKASADTELTLSEVKPIQTDFYFFALEMRDKLRAEAEKEVKSSTDESKHSETELLYLINTNLNARIMKAWEDLEFNARDEYAKKEEADRRRFMEEDEVASRHCATLTARVKSPPGTDSHNRQSAEKVKSDTLAVEEDTNQEDGVEKRSPEGELDESDASPSKKNRIDAVSSTAI